MIKNKVSILFIIILTAATTAVSYSFLFVRDRVANALAEENNLQTEKFLESPYNSKEMYDEVFSQLEPASEISDAKAGVVSHHLLAKKNIAEFYNEISSDKVDAVFVISPDHYGHFYPSGVLAYTSSMAWKTPYGNLEALNNISIDSIQEDDAMMGMEHGIYIQIPFIKKFFPNAKVIPIVVDLNSNPEEFKKLGKEIKDIAGENSILIISSDFSHNVSAAQSSQQDKESIQELKNIDQPNLDSINSDCKQCIAVLSGFLSRDECKFNLLSNKNSKDFGDNNDTVTSYISGFYSIKKNIQILFTGDIMLDRGIKYFADKNGSYEFLFDKVYSTLTDQDIVVSNLEGPITNNKSLSYYSKPGDDKNFIFTFEPKVAQVLYLENIKMVNLGNNHILNFGTAGEESTKKYLTEAGVSYFGSPSGPRSVVIKINGIRIGFVGYNEFSGLIALEQSQTISEIQKLKSEVNFLVVLPHWGIEYISDPTEDEKNLAHQFINAGADLIIGTHPHVIQSAETYNSKKIYYSLGNFMFDQYLQNSTMDGLGIILNINIETKIANYEELHFLLQPNGQTAIK